LTDDQEAAYDEINNLLKGWGFSTPVTATDNIKDAEAYIAASKFRGRRHTETALREAEAFQAEALRILQNYKDADEIPFGVAQA